MTKARTLADNFAADINAVTAGTGITGGGTSGTVTVTNSMATAIDAKGDLVVGTGADTFSRLAVASTAGYLLSVDSAETTGLKWAAPSSSFKGCRIYNDGTISIANNTTTALTFDSEFFDIGGFHSTVSNTSRITIPTGLGGYYLFDAGTVWPGNATGNRYIWMTKNGNRFGIFSNPVASSAASNGPEVNVQIIINASAGDYFELNAEQSSGGALNLGSVSFGYYLYFACAYLGA
jgi:hypothetical protein